ncbi:MAG: methyltransferase domain-containing protein [Candidatus Omnitrophota bacterium]|nr:methyltransferase domain-containing protein [Candidatus Omnitrophota bacterium]
MSERVGRLIKKTIGKLPFFIRKIYTKRKKREELFDYWTSPNDGNNNPTEYLKCRERSAFLLNLITKYLDKKDRVLEIGCNVGRNLNELFCAGFNNLSGVEINKNAIEIMKTVYPNMAQVIKIYQGPVENFIGSFEDDSFDSVYTMAVLEHIHTDSEFIFSHMARIARKILVTIEDERGVSWRHFPRNYKKVFEDLGMRQIEEISLKQTKVEGLDKKFFARVFKK